MNLPIDYKGDELKKEHTEERIKARLSEETRHSYLGDFVLGAIDGSVTTFTVVSGVAGAGLPSKIAIVLGMCNLLGDGFSMAAGNYLKSKADMDTIERARKIEEGHIDMVPEGEREEVRQIFQRKGLSGTALEEVVKVITSNRRLWVDTMLVEELGLRPEGPSPLVSAIVTMVAFCLVGAVPLFPYFLLHGSTSSALFKISATITGLSFFAIGLAKGRYLQMPALLSGLETLTVGGVASLIAFYIGYLTKEYVMF